MFQRHVLLAHIPHGLIAQLLGVAAAHLVQNRELQHLEAEPIIVEIHIMKAEAMLLLDHVQFLKHMEIVNHIHLLNQHVTEKIPM